ncbi:MAG TPA: hypothetical protein VH640_01270 [Bryobacteraceae bacterium]|jgi:hypothetical protein
MGLISGFRKAFRVLKKMHAVSQSGAEGTWRDEVLERAERAVAVPVPHDAVKATFRITNPKKLPYESTESPLYEVREFTWIYPSPVEVRKSGSYFADVGDGEASGTIEVFWSSTLVKDYRITPRISGSHHAKGPQPERRHNPFVGFCYYDRTLINTSTSSACVRLSGGIETHTPQFACVIHDGIEVVESSSAGYGGFQEINYWKHRRRPVRLCLLGELDDRAEFMHIRRIILNGDTIAVSKENISLALAYGAGLIDQIMGDKHYDPLAAWQAACNAPTLPHTSRPNAGLKQLTA